MTIQQFIRSRFTKVLIPLLLAAQLVACGGGGEDSSPVVSSPVVTSSQAAPSSPAPSSPAPSSPAPSSPTVTGSTTLSWTAPVARADGSPLSLADIEGYRIYYGTSAGNYPNSVDINDGTAVQLTLNNLPVGTYHLVMTTYDVAGRESVFSPEVIKTI
jgi:hypothetical protein